MIRTLLVLFMMLVMNTSYGQHFFTPLGKGGFGPCGPKRIARDGKNAVLLGYNYSGKSWGELGFVRGYRMNYNTRSSMIATELLYSYFSVSSEVFVGDNFIVCPKISYHHIFACIDVGISAFDYTDFNNNKLGLRPEIGLSLGGLVSVCYGYNITDSNDSFGINNHNLNLRLIMRSKLFYQMPSKKND